ncbi:MAG: 50S ribosomal protein L17 [Opitutae bacterium]|nr:50S ribosomal protein L17 [Opitutae bacterium]
MRHKKHHASLGVTREHRKAMLSNLGASLITHSRIETTLTKAKALRPFIEKVITKAKKAAALPRTDAGKLSADAIHLRRMALKDIRDETAVTLLFNKKVAQFAQRPGGYTRIYKLGQQRLGDAAEMALIEFIGADDVGYSKSRGKKKAKKSGAPKPAAPTAAAPAAEVSAEASAKEGAAPDSSAEAPAKAEAPKA